MNQDSGHDEGRRRLLKVSGAMGLGLSAGSQISAALAESTKSGGRLKDTIMEDSLTTADILIESLIAWGVRFVFGLVGDGINPITESLRKRQDRIQFVTVRHEEAAAFMACGYAKHTGKLGVCLATTGPGAIHLLNGLYDAKFDSTPVLAITGTTFHDLIGTRFMQSVDTVALMEDVALYNVQVSGPRHAKIVANLACRAALAGRGVAHLTIAKDVQAKKLSDDKPSMENHGLTTPQRWEATESAPGHAQLLEAAELLNTGQKIAILAGQGALNARAEVERIAELLGAPVAKALLGKAVLADDSPYTTGGIGHLGTQPSQWAMETCDSVLILGSTMPWIDSYPKPGQARGIQVDLNGAHIGLRYPVEVGIVADVKSTLAALIPLIRRKSNRDFLTEAQTRVRKWHELLEQVAAVERTPIRPQMLVRSLSEQLAPNAIISLDCGANTHFAARMISLRPEQKFTGTGLLATMGPGLSYAIAAQLAYPGRQCVAVVGDGGFTQLMGELATAVKYKLPVKVLVLSNESLAEVRFEQAELGNPVFGCDLAPIDFAAYARACGADGFSCSAPSEVKGSITKFLASTNPAVLDARVDANEKPAMPQELKV
jgi:pyruvate dehydrogenase (quinone)